MFFKLLNANYFLIILLSVAVTMTTNSWMMCWILMEINLMMFIPLITDKEYLMECPQAIKYFLVQVLGSIIIMFFLCMENTTSSMNMMEVNNLLMMVSLCVKSGVPPFHFWFPQILEFCNLFQSFMLLTVQKVIPIALMYFCSNSVMTFFLVTSALVGGLGGLNQNSLKKILAFSSMVHSSWLMLSIKTSVVVFMVYFLVYTFISMCIILMMEDMNYYKLSKSVINSSSSLVAVCFSMNMMSLGGLPPLLGFLTKAMVVMAASSMSILLSILLMASLLSLSYYMRVVWVSMTNSYIFKKEKLVSEKGNYKPFYVGNAILNVLAVMLLVMYL